MKVSKLTWNHLSSTWSQQLLAYTILRGVLQSFDVVLHFIESCAVQISMPLQTLYRIFCKAQNDTIAMFIENHNVNLR